MAAPCNTVKRGLHSVPFCVFCCGFNPSTRFRWFDFMPCTYPTSSRFLALAVPSCFVGGINGSVGVRTNLSAEDQRHPTRIERKIGRQNLGAKHMWNMIRGCIKGSQTRTKPNNAGYLEINQWQTYILNATNYQSAGLWNINQQCVYKYCIIVRSTCQANVQASDTR